MEEDFRKTVEENLNDPCELERLYHKNRKLFSELIREKKTGEKPGSVIDFWLARLNYSDEIRNSINIKNYLIYMVTGLLCWLPIRFFLMIFFEEQSDIFYLYVPLIFCLLFGMQFIFRPFNLKKMIIFLIPFLALGIYFAVLPGGRDNSQSLKNIMIHSPVILWSMTGFLFCNFEFRNYKKRFDFLVLTGEITVWTGLIMIATVILIMVAITLFEAVGMKIDDFILDNIGTLLFTAAPFLAVPISERFGELKIMSVLAKLFTPPAALTLLAYLAVTVITGKIPFDNRDILITYNIILVSALALIIYTNVNYNRNKFLDLSVLILAAAAIITNGTALSAIVYRIGRYGFSPNKITVLGINLIIMVHLVIISVSQIKSFKNRENNQKTVDAIVSYMPVYALWALLVVFIVPFVFKFE